MFVRFARWQATSRCTNTCQMAGHPSLHRHSPDGRPAVVVGCPRSQAFVLCCLHGSKRRGNAPPKSQLGLPDWSNKHFIFLKIDSIRWTRFKTSCQHASRDNVVCVLLDCEWDCGNSTGCLLPPNECVLNFDGMGLAMTYQVHTGGVRRIR